MTLAGTVAFGPADQGRARSFSPPGTPGVTEHLFEVDLLADYLLENPETFQL